jgi:hypothetical protein
LIAATIREGNFFMGIQQEAPQSEARSDSADQADEADRTNT